MRVIVIGAGGTIGSAVIELLKNEHAVSPPLTRETAIKMGQGPNGMPAAEMAQLYKKALESSEQGKIFGFH